MNLAITFELPIGREQIDADGLLSDRVFDKLNPALDAAGRMIAVALTAGEEPSCTWEIVPSLAEMDSERAVEYIRWEGIFKKVLEREFVSKMLQGR